MTDMCGSSNFLGGGGGGGGGGRTESDRKMLCQLFGPQTYLQWVQRPRLVYSGINCQFTVLFGSKEGPTSSRGGGRTQLLNPYRTCDF